MAKKRPVRVSVRLPAELLGVLDNEIIRLKALGTKSRVTREHAIQAIIQKCLLNLQPHDVLPLYKEYLGQAGPLKLHAKKREGFGEIGSAKRSYLRAAAFELLAMSTLDEPDEITILKHLMEVLSLIQRGTGYKSLPNPMHGTSRLPTVTGSA